MFSDLRYAVRGLIRTPAFTLAAALTLALGIGVNAAVFSVTDAALFRPLPYRNPDQLVEFVCIQEAGTPRERAIIGMTRNDAKTWRQQTQVFESLETTSGERLVLDGQNPERVAVAQISADVPALLGVVPLMGRSFRPEESVRGAGGVVLIGERFWRTRFGGDPAVLGRTLSLSNRRYTIVGVMPSSFRFPNSTSRIWLPLPTSREPGNPASAYIAPLARLRPGLSLTDAQQLVNAASARLDREQPRRDGWTIRLVPLDQRRADTRTRFALLVLLGAVGVVWLTACANVANLFLARSVRRRQEIAIRSAIGASPARLIRQFLLEGVAVALIGATAAAVAAWWGMAGLREVVSPLLPESTSFDIELNRRVLLFMLGSALAAGLVSALIPALKVARFHRGAPDLGGSRTVGLNTGHRRVRQGLAVVQVALTFVLLLGAGLLANSFIRMTSVDVGFDATNLVVAHLDLPDGRYPTVIAHDEAYARLAGIMRSVPGVRDAAVTGPVPPQTMFGGTLVVENDPAPPLRGFYNISLSYVSLDHFRILGIPLIEGRPFMPADLTATSHVVIIDRQTAHRYWPSGSALGKRIKTVPGEDWRTVVGVVGRVQLDRENAGFPQMYQPFEQNAGLRSDSLIIRTSGDPADVIAAIRDHVRAFDPGIVVASMSTVNESYAGLNTPSRVFLILMSVFALTALALAAVGLYGILAYLVAQRTQEIGVRMALGAQPAQVRMSMLREGLTPVAVGLALGLFVSVWTNRLLSALLFQVTPHDPVTTVAVALFLLAVAMVATYLPAARACKVDPLVALRAE